MILSLLLTIAFQLNSDIHEISEFNAQAGVTTIFGEPLPPEWFYEKSTEATLIRSYFAELNLENHDDDLLHILVSNQDDELTNYLVAEWTQPGAIGTERALIKLAPKQKTKLSLHRSDHANGIQFSSAVPFRLQELGKQMKVSKDIPVIPPRINDDSLIYQEHNDKACTCFTKSSTKIKIINDLTGEHVIAWIYTQISSTQRFWVWVDYPRQEEIFHEPKYSSTYAICDLNFKCSAKTQRYNNPGMTHIWYELNNALLSGGRGRVECEFDCVSPGISWTYFRSN